MPDPEIAKPKFSFVKGGDDVVAPRDGEDFDWEKGALRVRENLHDALNAKNLAFLFGCKRSIDRTPCAVPEFRS